MVPRCNNFSLMRSPAILAILAKASLVVSIALGDISIIDKVFANPRLAQIKDENVDRSFAYSQGAMPSAI